MNIVNTKRTILIIDDDEFERKVFIRTLSYASLACTVYEADGIDSGIEVLRNQYIDCVFLDYSLHQSTAFDAIAEIRKQGFSTNIAIITALKDEQVAVNLLKAGAIDYLNKSDLSPDKLEQTIHAAIKITRIEQEKKDAEVALKYQLAKLEAVLESTDAIVFAVNSAQYITTFNTAFKQLYQRIFLKEVDTHTPLNQNEEIRRISPQTLEAIAKALSGEKLKIEQSITYNKIETHFFEIAYNPIINDQNEVSGVAIFAQDITEKKRNEQALLKARNEALKAAQAKSDFLSNMSHEIRTPMNAIIGITDLLLEKLAIPENREYLQSIKYSADNLLYIINDILDLSKIEAGKVELEQTPFQLKLLFNELKKTFQVRADEKNIALNFNFSSAIPKYLKGDPFRLNQILLNLIGNALKFTSKGSVSLSAELKKQQGEHAVILFSVTDTGIGIPHDRLASIFESFTQAYTDTTRKFGGTGLGLAISKNLVELQNGYMDIQSTVGEGSTFYFEIPYSLPHESEIVEIKTEIQSSQAHSTNEISSLNGARILLVEDNSLNQFVAKQLLKKWHAEVSVSETGFEALASLRELVFDVVLMDLQMPEMNGFEATALIRNGDAGERNTHIPIIALTADAFEETRKRVLEAGMNDFITKPFKQDDLFNKIAALLKR